jgi:hemoglobin
MRWRVSYRVLLNSLEICTQVICLSLEKSYLFLSGWLGGPKLYAECYGSINIPLAHKHLSVGIEESEAWLFCMQKAIDKQPYEAAFKIYLMKQLRVPAERIRMASTS